MLVRLYVKKTVKHSVRTRVHLCVFAMDCRDRAVTVVEHMSIECVVCAAAKGLGQRLAQR